LFYVLSVALAVAGMLVLYLRGRYATVLYMGVAMVLLVVVWRLGFLRMTLEEKAAADRYLVRKRAGRGGGQGLA
jgi:hypothetical protein